MALGSWVFDHVTTKPSRLSEDMNNRRCSKSCPRCSSGRVWCSSVVEIVLQLKNDGPGPPFRFRPPAAGAAGVAEVLSRLSLVHGPETHWEFLGYSLNENLTEMKVGMGGFTRPQKWIFNWDVERFEPGLALGNTGFDDEPQDPKNDYQTSSIELDEHELAIVEEAAKDAGIPFDPNRKVYTMGELEPLGVVREAYSAEEVRSRGLGSTGVVTSFDEVAHKAETELAIGAPFASSARKWQLPVDVPGFRLVTTVFPPGSVVGNHTHSVLDPEVKSGGFRMVISGSIEFEGKRYGPGDWFFIPNGTPYSFSTDPDVETKENYWYGHRHRKGFVRISRPKK